MKIRLVYETDVSEFETQYDALHCAVSNLSRDIKNADSMDDLADVFKHMYADGKKEY